MRSVHLRILGLLGALVLLFTLGLATQAHPVSAAAPALTSAIAGPSAPVVSTPSERLQAGTDNSTIGEMQEAAIGDPGSIPGMHLERRLKLHHYWTAENGAYCTIKGGGEVFVPEGSTPEAGLTC